MQKQNLLMLSILAATTMAAAQEADLPIQASRPAPMIEEISVVGRFITDEKRSTASISNIVGIKQFERSGDSNVAESLKRVSGVSTVGGKFVYIRGLGERYSTTLLNGAILPSPEPINRVVPLDLFPTAVLESVLVQKTYSAQFPAEFGGGILQMRTRKSTDEFFWNLSSSVGVTPGVTFNDGLSMPGGDTDWLGIDDGYRGIPDALNLATAGGKELKRKSAFLGGAGYTPEELQVIGRSMRNEYNIQEEELPANYGLSTSLGNFHEIGNNGMQINYIASIDYSNSWDSNEILRNSYKTSDAGLERSDELVYFGTENSIDASAIFSAGLDLNANHNIQLTSVLLRKTDNITSRTSGDLAAEDIVILTETEWVERELFSNQLQGDHYFPQYRDLVLNWRYSKITAENDSPDNRYYRYDLTQSGYEFSTRADGNVRRFSVLDDSAEDLGIDFTFQLYSGLSADLTAQTGFVHTEKRRDSEIRRYSFFDQGALAFDSRLLAMPMETILAYDNIGPHGFELREFTRPTDSYHAASESDAVYSQLELNVNDRYRLTAGVRQEDFSQGVTTFDLFRKGSEIKAQQQSRELLPVISATLILDNHQFRAVYSETLSRPDFRELSPSGFTNPITGIEVVGNPALQIASIKNYDFRWEWYLGFTDYMALGFFYKEFTNPIETVIQGGADNRRTYANAKSADNQGVEYEIYKRLDFLRGIGEDFYIQGNITYIESLIDIRTADQGVLTNTSRPLQGQSDWLFNAQIGYEPMFGTTATLLYHYFGERIAEVGISGAPDVVEEPFGELNFTFIHELGEHWSLGFKAKNILDESSETTQGGHLVTGYDLGREFSLKLDYHF